MQRQPAGRRVRAPSRGRAAACRGRAGAREVGGASSRPRAGLDRRSPRSWPSSRRRLAPTRSPRAPRGRSWRCPRGTRSTACVSSSRFTVRAAWRCCPRIRARSPRRGIEVPCTIRSGPSAPEDPLRPLRRYGTSFAMGLPARPMTISSPASARSSSRERLRLGGVDVHDLGRHGPSLAKSDRHVKAARQLAPVTIASATRVSRGRAGR